MFIEKGTKITGFLNWIDQRLPVTSTWKKHLSEYYAPKNFNFWYFFGSLALLVLFIQLLTGIFLVMHYKPDAEKAFQSVEYIMREVPWGWLIRYLHSTGASMFFIVIYLHILRGFFYGSYKKPRELVWIFGVLIFLCLMAEAFFGYLLPWGQMSYWGAQVIVNLFSAIPLIGPKISLWIRGDYVVSDATLNRFFSFHVIAIPLFLIVLVVLHIIALHEVGSNNPDGIELKNGPKNSLGWPRDTIPFHPFYTVHDFLGVVVFLFIFCTIVFFFPEMKGYFLEYNNFIPADPLKTPPHIAPVWYFTPFYSMLRATTDKFTWVLSVLSLSGAFLSFKKMGKKKSRFLVTFALIMISVLIRFIDAKFWGVVIMSGAVIILFFLPWLDNSAVKSIRYRPFWQKVFYGIFIINFLMLGFLGTQTPTAFFNLASQFGTVIYLVFFLFMPFWSSLGTFKMVPKRVKF